MFILIWCEFINFFFGEGNSGKEKERNRVLVLIYRGLRYFVKFMYDWLCFMEYNLFYVYFKENFLVVIIVVCKYLFFIIVCLKNGIKKKIFFFWMLYDLDFLLKFN